MHDKNGVTPEIRISGLAQKFTLIAYGRLETHLGIGVSDFFPGSKIRISDLRMTLFPIVL